MSRTRLALLGAGILLFGSCVLGCGATVMLETQPPPWTDVELQRADWGRLGEPLIAVAIILLVCSAPLLSYAFVNWHKNR